MTRITMGPVFLIHAFMCLMKGLFFTQNPIVNGYYVSLASPNAAPPPLQPFKDNQKQIYFCYLFVLLCFVFQSGHIVLKGRQEIVSQ